MQPNSLQRTYVQKIHLSSDFFTAPRKNGGSFSSLIRTQDKVLWFDFHFLHSAGLRPSECQRCNMQLLIEVSAA